MAIGVDQRNFFLQREPRKQILDAHLDWFGAVKIRRALLRASVPETCHQNRDSKQRYRVMLDFGHQIHNFSICSICVNQSGH